MQNTYKYAGQPLTPTIAGELILEYFGGEFARQELTKQVNKFHLENGGHKCISMKYNPVGVALDNLTKEGIVKRLKRGRYLINSHSSPSLDDRDGPKTIGSGNGFVYLYYYPAYKLLAGFQGKSSWSCKIGMTDGDPNLRAFAQAGTGMPEEPEIGLIIRTDAPSDVERRIHDILRIFDRHIEDAPGTEWFLTNPGQVEEIFNSL